jgi:hypothetical protein
MPRSQSHRGPHPDDARLFGAAQLDRMRTAAEEASYLLGRGYTERAVLDVVGGRHRLEARQRLALGRCMCSEAQRQGRQARRVPASAVAGGELFVDGFNLIIGLEVAVSGGVLLRGLDGALRDLAGLRGTYRPVQETERALELLGAVFRTLAPLGVHVLLDAPISNSGKLRTRILERATDWPCPVDVALVPDPDRELVARALVVSSDSGVIDTAQSWVNLLEHVVRAHVPEAWIVDLRQGAPMVSWDDGNG